MTEKKLNLGQRLIAIMRDAGVMKKDGRNEFNNYSYVKESDVAEKFQGLLCEHGVFLFSSAEEVKTEQVTSSKGKVQNYTEVKVQYTFVNVDDPVQKQTVWAFGSGMDTGDKG